MKKNAMTLLLVSIILITAGCGDKGESNTNSQTVTEAIAAEEDGKYEEDADAQSSDSENNEHIIILEEDPYTEPTVADDTSETAVVTDDMYGEFDGQIDIYNSIALNKFLGDKYVTIDDINEVIDSNTNIDSRWKDIIKDFAERIISEYPEIDMRLFYENCKRLAIEYDPYESLGGAEDKRLAFYNYEDGIIHVQESIDYDSPYNLMIIRHELGHMISLGIIKSDTNKKIVCVTNFSDYGVYLREAIDVIISSKPYEKEYNFTDFGYSIIANELEVVLNAIPDFDISVLANQDVYNIAGYLQDVNYNSVSASRFISLMDQQTIDYYDFASDEPLQQDYKDIYRYIANTYVNHVLNKNMSSEEVQQISDTIKENLSKNLDHSFELDGIEEIDRIFNEYLSE